MDNEFDLDHWDRIKHKLKIIYPQLTDSDLLWRHESKDSLFNMIANKLVISKKEFIDIVDSI